MDIGSNISFLDDIPIVEVKTDDQSTNLEVDETTLGTDASKDFSGSFSNTVVDAGSDGQESLTTEYSLKATVADSGLVDTATGEAIHLSTNASGVVEGRTATSDDLVFTVSTDNSGEVTLDQIRAIEHSDSSDENETSAVITDNLITLTKKVTIVDSDGDATEDSASLDIGSNISFLDDIAVAKDNEATVVEGATLITGNVITDTNTTDGTDVVGADGAMLNEFTYRDVDGVNKTIIFTDDANQVVTTKTGSLTVNRDGTWIFTPIASVDHDNDKTSVGDEDNSAIDGSFTYKLIDNDGDISNEATNTITVTDTIATVIPVDTVLLDEDDLSNGSDTAKESLVSADTTLGITVGQDDITDVLFDLTKVSTDSNMTSLKSDGEALVFSVDASNHILTAKDHNDNDVFIVTINDNGVADKYDEGSTYKFELKGSLDHALAEGENSLDIEIPFSIKEIDDIAEGTMSVGVVDDVPVAYDNPQQDTLEGSGVGVGGNLITDADATDIVGADSAELKEFTYRDDSGVEQTILFTDDSSQTVQTETGELTISRNGTWTFHPIASFDHDNNLEASDSLESADDMPEDATNASFSYTLVDGDGDESTAKQIINVTDGANPTIDNSNNTLVTVYEGDSKSTLDGTEEYNESATTETKDNIATVTHKLDFTEGSDTAYISQVSWTRENGNIINKNIMKSDGTFKNAVVFKDDDTGKGTLKVFKDGTWEYTPPATFMHDNPTAPDAFDINSFTTTFSYKVHDIDNDEVTDGSQSIQIDDTIALIEETTNILLNEANLAAGTDPNDSELTQTGSITVDNQYLGEEATHTVRFQTTQTDAILSIDNDGDGESDLSSLGSRVHHEVSADGFTLTLLDENNDPVLTTTINNPTDENPTYTTLFSQSFNQTPALHRDEFGNQDDDGMFYFEFDIEVEDDDGDIRDGKFKITIVDDETPDSGSMVVDEDSTDDPANTLQSNANVTQENTQIITQGAHGIAQIDINGKFNYIPTENYSGVDQVIVETTLDDATKHTVTMTITVNPLADAPEIEVTNISTIEDANEANDSGNEREGANSVALGLSLPALSEDQTDQNGADAGDHPERNGYTTLTIDRDATISNGTTDILTSAGSVKIYITDASDYYYTGLDPVADGALQMTQAEYEALTITHKEDDAQNIEVGLSVTSYEVNDSGEPLDIDSDTLTSTVDKSFIVDVIAVTDPVAIELTDTDGAGTDVVVNSPNEVTLNMDEDVALDMQNILVEKFGDYDDSELHSYRVNGLENGTEVTINGTTKTYTGSELTFTFPKDTYDPTFSIKAKENYSGDMSGTITLVAHDTDADSADSAVDETDAITINLHVKPVADDVAIDAVSTKEDTAVKFLDSLALTDDDTDGNEEITELVVKALKDGWVLKDESGAIVLTGDGSSNYTIDMSTVTMENLTSYTLTPPAHSSKDDTVDISVKVKDTEGTDNDIQTFDHTIDIEVTAVTDKESTDSDNSSGDDVQLNLDHIYQTHGREDILYDLFGADSATSSAFVLSASNEDDESVAEFGSEVTTVVFDNIRHLEHNDNDGLNSIENAIETSIDEAVIQYTDSTGNIVTKSINAGDSIEVPLDSLESVKLLPPPQFSGSLRLDMKVVTEDFDEDDGVSAGKETSNTSELTILYIDPVAEEALVFGIAQSVGYEDDGRNTDGSTDIDTAVDGLSLNVHVNTLDTTETFNIYFDNIPEDAAIYYDIDGDNVKELITATTNDLGTVEVASATATSEIISDNGDGTWKLLIENYDNDNIPILVPPHNSNVDFDIDVSGYAVDSVVFADGTEATDVGAVSDTYPIAIKLQGIADELSGDELNTLSIDGTDDTYGGKTNITDEDDVDGVYAIVVEEDSNNTKDGAEINIKDLFKNGGLLDSYDNVADNDPTQTPTDTGSYESETLTVSLTGLAEGFEVEGALFLGGTGEERVWVMKHTDVNDGNVKVTTGEHYSGEVDFKLKYITTEDDGDSLTTPEQDVKVLVTPVVEATVFDESETTLKEDTLTQLDFKSKLESADSDEEIVELLVLKSDVDDKTFKVYYGNSQETTLEEAVTTQAVEVVTIDSIDYYKIHNADTQNLYAQHNRDIGGTEESLDSSFNFKYIVRDQANAVDANGNTIIISDLQATPYEDATYQLGFEAVTDNFDVSIKNAGITSTNAGDISVDSNEITINTNTTISVAVTLLGEDTAGEVALDNSATTNGRDEDGSEIINRLKVDDLPDGIGVVGGYKIGSGTQENTSNWYINIPTDEAVVFDGGEKSYTMEFEVFGDNSTYVAESSDVKVTFYNQDGSADIVEDSVTVKFIKKSDGGGFDDTEAIGEAPMDILTFEENPAFVGFLEDTEQALSDIITLNINDTGTNVQLNEEITSQKFLLEVKDIVNGSATITKELDESSQNQWIKDNDSYIYRGEGDASAIQTALDTFTIIATQDDNWNTGREGDPDKSVDFTANITTYTTSGVEDYASFDYSGEVKPVTDDVNAIQTITDSNGDVVGSIKEDEIGKIELDLSSVDGEYRSSVESENSTELATSYLFTYSSENTFDVIINDTLLRAGDEIEIDITDLNNITFEAEANAYGEAKFSYRVYSHENDADNIVSNDLNFSVTVDPVADGSVDLNPDGSNPLEDVQAIGDEDTLIEITSDVGQTLTNLLGGGSETLTSLMLKGVPNGYLVYIGEENNQELAMNAGKDGETADSNSWYLQLNNGDEAPRVWIKAPNNIGGVAPTSLLLKTGVDNSLYREDSIDLQVNAVADKLAIKPSDTRGHEGDEVRLYFNMAAEDVDGSEYYEVKLKGLGEGALFTLDGTVIDENNVTYHSGTDTYTIASTDVTYATIDKIYVIQNDLQGKSIDATVDAIEKTNSNRDGASTTASFKITIEDQKVTNGDDTLIYDDEGVDGGDGVDTVYLAGDTSIDTTALKNIEILDMTQYDRDYTLNTLTTQAVTDMTDENNELIIRANEGDHIDLESIEDVAGGWTKVDDTHYHSFDDPTITVTFNDNSALIDGVIEGMYYETSSGFTGYTDTDGNFDYIDGDTVIFKIGSLVIGSMDMNEINDDKVFLQDLASVERSDMSDAYVENMAVLLQSLDGDSTDKILITEQMQEALSEEEFDLATVEQDELESIIEKTGQEVISTEDAMEHVEEMLEEYDGIEQEDKEESEDVAVEDKEELEDIAVEDKEELEDVAVEDKEELEDVAVEDEKEPEDVVVEDEKESEDIAVEDKEESEDVVVEDEKESEDVVVEDEKEPEDVVVEDEKEPEDVVVEDEKESEDIAVEDKEESEDVVVEDEKESITLDKVIETSSELNTVLPKSTTPTDSSSSSTVEPISDTYYPDPTVSVTVDTFPDVLI